MKRRLYPVLAATLALLMTTGSARIAAAQAGYRVQQTARVGGDGGFDYVYADSEGRKLYIPRQGANGRISIFNLDTLSPVGEIPASKAHGVAVDAKFHHGFSSSSPVVMWDTKTLQPIKTIQVDGGPDGILADAFNHRIYIFSHSAPNVTVIDAAAGSVVGTIDLGGAPEQAAADGRGRLFVDLENKDSVAVVDVNALKVTATYGLNGKGGTNAGLALDAKNNVLFVACRDPKVMVMLDARDGKYLADLPIGRGCDGAVFNSRTSECISSQGDGTLTIIRETAPGSFTVDQTVQTMVNAKTLTLDRKTGKILVISGEFGPAPAPQPGKRMMRGPLLPGSFSILVIGK